MRPFLFRRKYLLTQAIWVIGAMHLQLVLQATCFFFSLFLCDVWLLPRCNLPATCQQASIDAQWLGWGIYGFIHARCRVVNRIVMPSWGARYVECRDWQTKEESHYRHGNEYVSIKHRSKHMVKIAEKRLRLQDPQLVQVVVLQCSHTKRLVNFFVA